jgi:hypothetical protein
VAAAPAAGDVPVRCRGLSAGAVDPSRLELVGRGVFRVFL